MLIAVDVDGVLCDLHTPWLELYNDDWGDDLKVESILSWNIEEWVKPECGVEIFKYLDKYGDYLYADRTPMIPGALAGIKCLRRCGHKVIYVSSCTGEGMYDAKIKWMEKKGFLKKGKDHTYPDFIAASDKSLIRADVLIDDRPLTVKSFPFLGILFHQPWNSLNRVIPRLMHWDHLFITPQGQVHVRDESRLQVFGSGSEWEGGEWEGLPSE